VIIIRSRHDVEIHFSGPDPCKPAQRSCEVRMIRRLVKCQSTEVRRLDLELG
jgi:hypothetical protein